MRVAGRTSSEAEISEGNCPEAGGACHVGGTARKSLRLEKNELGEEEDHMHKMPGTYLVVFIPCCGAIWDLMNSR